MKKTAFILAALITGAALRADDTPAPAASYSVTADFPYVGKYVFRGVQLAKDSFQPSLKLTSGAAYVGIWNSTPFDSDTDNEIDFYGGYSFDLGSGWSVDTGATYYYYPQASNGAISHSLEGYVGLNGSIQGGVTVALYAYRDFNLDATTFQGTVGYAIPIDAKLSCNLSASAGYVSVDDSTDYSYYSVAANFPYKLTDKATVYAGVNYATNDLDGVDDNLFWVNAGFSYAF
jgi:uncharacterized protein (TIGR02001 family)